MDRSSLIFLDTETTGKDPFIGSEMQKKLADIFAQDANCKVVKNPLKIAIIRGSRPKW